MKFCGNSQGICAKVLIVPLFTHACARVCGLFFYFFFFRGMQGGFSSFFFFSHIESFCNLLKISVLSMRNCENFAKGSENFVF